MIQIETFSDYFSLRNNEIMKLKSDYWIKYRIRGRKGHCDECNGCVQSKFNDIKSSYPKNDSDRRQSISLNIFYVIIAIRVIYFAISNIILHCVYVENIEFENGIVCIYI